MMETKDIYTASGGVTGGSGMETKSVPGYVPSPLVLPDFVEPETEREDKDEKDDDKSADSKGTAKTASKTTAAK